MVRFRLSVLFGLCITMGVFGARTASAQRQEPPGPFVIDVRGDFAGFAPTDTSAAPFFLAKTQMPSRGFGAEVGAHVYPLRWRHVTIGIGGNWLTSRGNKVPDPVVTPRDPTVRQRFDALGTQLSLNFGTSEGWSYVSGGIGTSRRTIQSFPVTVSIVDGKPTYTQSTESLSAEGARSQTINYGGGARWFASSHFAFGFDLRWYGVSPSVATTTMPALPRQTLFIANAGISIH
jgi:hypothetical protein